MSLSASQIVEGKIWHARLQPTKHTFEYAVYFFKLDVDELSALSKYCRIFSLNQWNILCLRERNYLRPTNESLRAKVENLLHEHGVFERPSQIELVTQLRYFGWVFNPVSFFFCWSSERKLIATIVDVNNTFGEGHAYVLKDFHDLGSKRLEARAEKVFHVSPFFNRKGNYRFELCFHESQVNIILDYYENGILQLASSWTGSCLPFKTSCVFSVLSRYPFAGWLTVLRIHVQAAALFLFKKLPIFKKPEPESVMTIRRKK